MRPVWAEVDLGAVAANTAELRSLVSPSRLCAVVKADAYGHGAVPVARAAIEGGADLLAVALVAEGVELRTSGIDAQILVLSQASRDELDDLIAYGLDACVYTDSGIEDLSEAARRGQFDAEGTVGVHLKVDTGMRRVGAQTSEALRLAELIDKEPLLHLLSVFTHCAVADDPDSDFTDVQLDRFDEVLGEIAAAGIEVHATHAANTAAAIEHERARQSFVRIGIGLYGLAPSPALDGRVMLSPAMSLRARVSHVKRVSGGEGISYGLKYRPGNDTTIATVPLGYADGLSRRYGEKGGTVLIGGRPRRIAGSVTMDQIMVDCGDDPVQVGDEVVLIGQQGDQELKASDWARILGTISYEVVCAISPRVPRRYKGDGQ